jgi:fatty-acyl-CoA synthase
MSQDIELDWLKKWNLYSPKKVAIQDIFNNKKYTYSDFYKISQGLVPYLKSLGISKGDRVAIFAENYVETLFLFFALKRMGAILVPINFRFSKKETEFVLSDSGANILFYDDTNLELIESLSSDIHKIPIQNLISQSKEAIKFKGLEVFAGEYEKPCMILYTSGTTGFPKGVVITPKMLFWNSVNTNMSLNISSSDKMISFLPLFHTGGWNVLLTPFIHRGAETIFIPRFNAEQILNLCESKKITILFGVPTTLSMMANTKYFNDVNLKSLRFTVVGGEPMSLNMIQLWHNKGVAIRQGFGLTECGPNCFSLSEKDAETHIGSIGRPNFYVQTRIVNNKNQDVEIDEVGELLLKGPMCMSQYWQNEKANEEVFFEGWLRTGDLVKKDANDYFYVVGRKKEMFISGGENVYPAEIEKVMSQHPKIAEVAVIGIKDVKWGEVGKAFIVTKDKQNIDANEIFDFCKDKLARFKVPKQFETLLELPKGSTGKVLKSKLNLTSNTSP